MTQAFLSILIRGKEGGRQYLLRHAKCAGEVFVPNRQHERAVVVLVDGTVGHDINQKR